MRHSAPRAPRVLPKLTISAAILLLLLRLAAWATKRQGSSLASSLELVSMAGLLLVIVGLAAVAFFSHHALYAPNPTASRHRMAAIGALLSGAALLGTQLFDGVRWMRTGVTPAPNSQIIDQADRVLLLLTLAFGLLGGLALLWLGWTWLSRRPLGNIGKLGLLATVLWAWVRLARYEISFTGATQARQTFFDFALMIVITLFLMLLARYASRLEEFSARLLTASAAWTAAIGLSAPVLLLIAKIAGGVSAYTAGRIASPADAALGLFALLLLFCELTAPPKKPQTLSERIDMVNVDGADTENPQYFGYP